MTGAEFITEERERQQMEEGWTAEHDADVTTDLRIEAGRTVL